MPAPAVQGGADPGQRDQPRHPLQDHQPHQVGPVHSHKANTKINNAFIVRFYASTLSSVVRKDGGLAASLAELTRLAHAQFVSSLQNRSEPCLVTFLSSSTSVSH